MYWTEDGWLRLEGGSNIAKTEVIPSMLPEYILEAEPEREDFNSSIMPIQFYSPRIDYHDFTSLTEREGFLRIKGKESMSSLNRVSLIAHKLTSLHVCVTAKMDFKAEVYQQYAGILIYYDNMDYIMLRKTYNEKLNGSVIDLLRVKNGERIELLDNPVPVKDESIYLQLIIDNKDTKFFWSMDGKEYIQIGDIYDTSEFSDEFCKHGEFTGTFVGIGCVDALLHEKCADFDFFEYKSKL